jgi:hypothetical protein
MLSAKRQVSALEQGACDQRCLQPAALALEVLVFSYLKQVVIRVAAAWAAESLRPQRDASNASAHCSSVPNCARSADKDKPAWNWMWLHGHFSLVGSFGSVCDL